MVSSYPNNRSALSKHWSRLIHYNLTCYPRRNHGYLLAIQFILFSIRLSSSFSGYPRHNQSYPVACNFLDPSFRSSQKSHIPTGHQFLTRPVLVPSRFFMGKRRAHLAVGKTRGHASSVPKTANARTTHSQLSTSCEGL